MSRILLTLFTLFCFTACTTLQPLADTQPAPTEQSAGKASSDHTLWYVIGALVVVGVIVAASNSGGGGGGGGY